MTGFQIKFEAIGTQWVLDCYEEKSTQIQSEIKNKIIDYSEKFEKNYSRFRNDSIIYEISKKSGIYEFPKEDLEFLEFNNLLSKITQSKFTLLIGATLSQAGYDKDYSLIPKKIEKLPIESEIFELNQNKLIIKKPFILDFGGTGKGYLIKKFSELLNKFEISSYCIDGSGDIFYKTDSSRKLRVGLENPDDFNQVIGVSEIINQSICSSSSSRRKWGNFHHIINPETLNSPDKILSSWVTARDPMIADGLATCLFLTNPEVFKKHFEFEYLILNSNFTINKSDHFPAELFLK